jgi:hypothetical protein
MKLWWVSSSISSIRMPSPAQDLHGRPRPERGLFLVGEAAFLAGGELDDVDAPGRALPTPPELLAFNREDLTFGGVPGGADHVASGFALLLNSAQQGG